MIMYLSTVNVIDSWTLGPNKVKAVSPKFVPGRRVEYKYSNKDDVVLEHL